MATDDDRFFSLLVGRLGARRAELTERILAEVRAHPGLQTPRQLDRPQLRDHLPALLERLGAYLQGKPPEEACPGTGTKRGRNRARGCTFRSFAGERVNRRRAAARPGQRPRFAP